MIPDTDGSNVQLEEEVIYDPVEFNLPNKPGQTAVENKLHNWLMTTSRTHFL